MSTEIVKKFADFGSAFRFNLSYTGIGVRELSRTLGVDHGLLSKYLNNVYTPKPRTVKKLCAELYYDIRYIDGSWVLMKKDEDLLSIAEPISDYVTKPKSNAIVSFPEFDDAEDALRFIEKIIQKYFSEKG